MYKTILVAVNNGPYMSEACERAINYAKAFNSHLILCHVRKNKVVYNSMISVGLMSTPHIIQDHSYCLDDALEDIKKEALEKGVPSVEIVQTHSSTPGTAIADVIAPGFDAELIICGKTDKSSLNRLLLESVSSNIVNYAKCDVLLVGPKEQDVKKKKRK